MSAPEVYTALITMGVFMFGTVLALVWYLGGRIDRVADRIDRVDDHLSGRIDGLDETVQNLREDVAVLKATS